MVSVYILVSLLSLCVAVYSAYRVFSPLTGRKDGTVILQAQDSGGQEGVDVQDGGEQETVFSLALNSFFLLSFVSLLTGSFAIGLKHDMIYLMVRYSVNPEELVEATSKVNWTLMKVVALCLLAFVLWVFWNLWNSVWSMGWLEIGSLVLMVLMTSMLVLTLYDPSHIYNKAWSATLYGMAISFFFATVAQALLLFKKAVASHWWIGIVLSLVFVLLQLLSLNSKPVTSSGRPLLMNA